LFQCVYVLVALPLHAQTSVRFTATVRAGDSYVHPIGHGLYFAVDQTDGGAWDFQVKPSKDSREDYSGCLGSPMLHGPETVDLLAWRFAPGADPGWAEHTPASKPIAFVTNAADQKYECAESDAVYNSFQQSQSKGKDPDYSGLRNYKPRPLGQGRVIIRSLTLKPGLTGTDAEFEQITMEIEVTFPGRGKTQPR
jgi:hypothetical protein